MKLFLLLSSILIASICIIFSSPLRDLLNHLTAFNIQNPTTEKNSNIHITTSNTKSNSILPTPPEQEQEEQQPMSTAASSAIKNTMSKALSHARIVPRRSGSRGHADHGWLNTYHTFSFANYYSNEFQQFGSLRVLNEDRVVGGAGFPTHPHRDAEIFSYILSGELTHRDSMVRKGAEGQQGDSFYRMHRGDVQFTTGGKGIAHSEGNEADEDVHFLQIWALPWSKGLTPRYHTGTFSDAQKREGFVNILSPLAAGPGASAAEEAAAEPALPNTIPIHADFVMGAGIIGVDKRFKWTVGANAVRKTSDRNVYVHLPMCKSGSAKIRLDGREDAVLSEGDGAFITRVNAGDVLSIESIGEAEAEVVILDSD